MFGNLLRKILPNKKAKPPLQGRELDGRNNVGYPTMQISNAIDDIVAKPYRDIKPLVKFYKDTFLFKWGPAIINNSLNDEQLKNLSGRNLQMVYLLLFRDMLRHISDYVRPKNTPDNWPNLLAQDILDSCKMLNDADDHDVTIKHQLFADTEHYNIETDDLQIWADPLAKLIDVPAKDLYYWHRSLTQTILKKVAKINKKT